ncbi:MAG: uncharacterized protein KVP18_004256 [Porospora cf. gigantea A]|nr:MAG: hypothetical protein KVP18_004256 [Porospora cf. gigantea A]
MIRSNPLGAKQDAADVIEPSDSLFNHDELVEEVMAAQEGEEEVDRQASDSSSSKAAVSDHEKGETVLSHVVSDDFATPNIEDMATSKIEETATSKTEEAATSIKEAAISIEEAAISKVEGSSTSVAPVVDVRLAPQAPVSESSKTVARPPESEEETTESFKLPPKLSIEEEVERRLSHMESDGKSVFSVKTRHGDMQAVPAAYWERRVQKKNLSEWILRRPDDLFQPRKYQILMHNPQPQDVFTDSRSSDRPSEVRTTGLQTPRSSLGSRAAPGSVGRSSTRSVDVSGSSYAVVAKDKTSGVASTMQSGDLDKSKSGSRSEVHSTISVSRSQPELGSNLAIGSVASDTTALVVR